MKKRLLAAAAALLCVLTACGNDKLPAALTDDASVYDDIELDDEAAADEDGGSSAKKDEDNPVSTAKPKPGNDDGKKTESDTSGSKNTDAGTAETAAPAKPQSNDYLKNIMFVGDDNCVPLGDTGRIDSGRLFAAEGLYAGDVLSHSFSAGNPVTWAEQNTPDQIYIWLGLNDLKYCNDYTYYMDIREVINTLHEASPDSVIVLMQLSPVARDSSWDSENLGGDGHYDISIYNEMLNQVVADSSIKELYYFEINSVLGEDGGTWLSPDYDGGDGIHLADSAYDALLDYISANKYANNSTSVSEDGGQVSSDEESDEEDEDEVIISEEETDPENEQTEGNEPLSAGNTDYTKEYPEMYSERSPYTVGDPKICYLTFDDGPSDHTEDVLDILAKNNIKATFFIVGNCVEGREDILKKTADAGHVIGIHTNTHDYDEVYASVDAFLGDFSSAFDTVSSVIGKKPWLFRFPGGSYNSFNTDIAESLIKEMTRRGFTYFDWNCATSDAAVGADYDSCVENFKSTLSADYEIVLMHDSKQVTSEYLQEIIDYAVEQGYTFDTLDNADTIHF